MLTSSSPTSPSRTRSTCQTFFTFSSWSQQVRHFKDYHSIATKNVREVAPKVQRQYGPYAPYQVSCLSCVPLSPREYASSNYAITPIRNLLRMHKDYDSNARDNNLPQTNTGNGRLLNYRGFSQRCVVSLLSTCKAQSNQPLERSSR